VEIPLGIFFHSRPSLSKPPPSPHQGPLRRLPSRRNPRISPVHAPLGMGVPFLYAVFAMDDGIAPSLSLGAHALVLDSVGLIRFSLKEACSRGSFLSREPRMELSWRRSIFLEILYLIRSVLTRAEFPPLAPEIPGWPDILSFGPEFPPPLAGISAPLLRIIQLRCVISRMFLPL
jgi:hypothetical protein